jgi:hypothetical protein
MGDIREIGLSSTRGIRRDASGVERVVTQRPLRRVMAFRHRSIDDIVNDPIVKSEILGYFKLQKQIERVSESVDLERQWNTTGRV